MSQEQQKALESLYVERQLTESNISLLQQRLEFSQVLLNSYRTGFMVLEELEAKKKDEEMLMNVGGGIFVPARLVNPERIMRTLGSGIRIEQGLEEAKKGIETAITSLENQYKQLAEEHDKMVAHLNRVNAQMNQLVEAIQGQSREG
ncbi:MAG: prefoldin subunit alpha [Candidatus Thorarchaeota archaeon]|nr:prefoldin subunit alpha [Candidatus Thorarchaeota archaeon]